MKTQLNDGRELRCGAIPGTQPGAARSKKEIEREERAEHKERMRLARGRMGRERFKPAPVERSSANGIVRRSYLSKPKQPAGQSVPEPPPIEEWDNPYLKRKVPKWEAEHRARVRAAQVKAASDPDNPVDKAAIIERDGSRCWICKKTLEAREIDFDHVIPLSRKGKHIPENVKVCCKPCNRWKGDRLVALL